MNRIVDITRKVKLQRANILYRFGDLKNVGNVHAYYIISQTFALSFLVGGVNLSPLFDNAEFQSSHVQRAFQYLKFWESARENLNQFWFIPSQVMGDHAECIETLTRYTLYKNFFFHHFFKNGRVTKVEIGN